MYAARQNLDFNELTKTHMDLYACTHSRRTRAPKTRKGRKNAHSGGSVSAQQVSKEELGVAWLLCRKCYLLEKPRWSKRLCHTASI